MFTSQEIVKHLVETTGDKNWYVNTKKIGTPVDHRYFQPLAVQRLVSEAVSQMSKPAEVKEHVSDDGNNPNDPLVYIHSTTEKKIDGHEPFIGHMHLSTAAHIHQLHHSNALKDLRAKGEHVHHDGKSGYRLSVSRHQKVWEGVEQTNEVAPEGWEGTVKAMKKHKDKIKNPWALAWSMKKKGYESHMKKEEVEQVDEADIKSKSVIHKGKEIGETGIDTEASPGSGGKWYAKHHKSNINSSGFASRREAEAEVREVHRLFSEENTKMYEAHEIGKKVTPIDDLQGIKKGKVYTVTDVHRKTLPFGDYVTHVLDGKHHIANGHIVLKAVKEEVAQIDEALDHEVDKYAHHILTAHTHYDHDIGNEYRQDAAHILKHIEKHYGPVGVRWAKARAAEHIDAHKRAEREADIKHTLAHHKPTPPGAKVYQYSKEEKVISSEEQISEILGEADVTSVWRKVYTHGSKAAQKRLHAAHGHKPEFKAMLKSIGADGGEKSVKQASKKIIHHTKEPTTAHAVKTQKAISPEVAKLRAINQAKQDKHYGVTAAHKVPVKQKTDAEFHKASAAAREVAGGHRKGDESDKGLIRAARAGTHFRTGGLGSLSEKYLQKFNEELKVGDKDEKAPTKRKYLGAIKGRTKTGSKAHKIEINPKIPEART